MNFYSENPRFFVAVDCIIFSVVEEKLCLLLTKRRFEPEMGKWSLMGGFVRDDESVDAAARRVLRQLTGLENVYMEQVGTFGEINRDPGERVISVAYYALLGPGEYVSGVLAGYDAEWVPIDSLPPLGFDHPRMVESALAKVRESIPVRPIGFNLLPELFTLTQLQALYETILGHQIDKRNFRKRIADTPCIEKTPFIDKISSRRGASLYRYNETLFNSISKFKI